MNLPIESAGLLGEPINLALRAESANARDRAERVRELLREALAEHEASTEGASADIHLVANDD